MQNDEEEENETPSSIRLIFPLASERPARAEIVLNHERILGFFAAHAYIDPTQFVLSCINKFQEHVHEQETTHVVKHDALLNIKEEYQRLRILKQNMASTLKAAYHEQMKLVDAIQLDSLGQYLGPKFDMNGEESKRPTKREEEPPSFRCPHCNIYVFCSKKSLAAHARSCIKKTASQKRARQDDSSITVVSK
jgi:hypothetical protein